MRFSQSIISLYYKAATGCKKLRLTLTPVGLTIFSFVVIFYILIALWFDRLFNFPPLLSDPASIYISIPVMFAGLFFISWSVITFLSVKGTPVPLNPPPVLVTKGPYAYTRNPMLTGLFIFMFGLGIYLQSVSLSFIFTPLFVLFNCWELKCIEEPELEKRLGSEYIEYKKRVPMFIPKLR